jgi:phosphoribosylpyrophosphate synthetase
VSIAGVPKAKRAVWREFPDVVIATTDETGVKRHTCYNDAKTGNALMAALLVRNFCEAKFLERVSGAIDVHPGLRVAAVHAEEAYGRNQIAEALAVFIASELGVKCEQNVVQLNIVNHTGASGFARLAAQALFDGEVEAGLDYLLVDDFIGQGGTLANLRGHIESQGGRVVGAAVLTGKPFSAKIALSEDMLDSLRKKHGSDIEDWWKERFGFGFDCLTESEARYLFRTTDAHTIRNRIVAARQT